MPLLDRHAQPLLRLAFVLALLVILAAALMPMVGDPSGNGDKVQHFAAFYALTLLGAAAFTGRKALTWLIVGLSAYGALIEILQPLPVFGRDRDVFDWVADNIGIALALAPFLVAGWRRRRVLADQ